MSAELLRSQKELRDLSANIVDCAPEGLHAWTTPSTILPGELVERLRAIPAGAALLVPDGESLCVEPVGSSIKDIGMRAGQALLVSAHVGATSLNVQTADEERENERAVQQDWSAAVEIELEYAHPGMRSIRVFETLVSETGSDKIGLLPTLGRTTFSPIYADAGFVEHQKQIFHRPDDELEVLKFLGIAREMFAGAPKLEVVE